jgi:hypothetical protein
MRSQVPKIFHLTSIWSAAICISLLAEHRRSQELLLLASSGILESRQRQGLGLAMPPFVVRREPTPFRELFKNPGIAGVPPASKISNSLLKPPERRLCQGSSD